MEKEKGVDDGWIMKRWIKMDAGRVVDECIDERGMDGDIVKQSDDKRMKTRWRERGMVDKGMDKHSWKDRKLNGDEGMQSR